ncbi:MAG: aminoglycoside phosphotransferase family protein [Magnetococcales bacterium]|nr:aminoglycoside phosphotransferase family protein [Magnetococcales bacterium]
MKHDDIHALARRIAGDTFVSLHQIRRGGNNQLYRLETTAGPKALKCYRQASQDPRNRQGRETCALHFFARHGLTQAPRLLDQDRHQGWSLLEWVEGVPVQKIAPQDVDQALATIESLYQAGLVTVDHDLPEATDAVLSGQNLTDTIERRHDRLKASFDQHPELAHLIQGRVLPFYHEKNAAAREAFKRAGIDWATPLPKNFRLPSPSDFGLHNALRQSDGRLIFLDFEYFGWDDPVKLASDMALHPGMDLACLYQQSYHQSDQQPVQHGATAEQLLQGFHRIFHGDPLFSQRLESLFPLFGVVWIYILLNEFRSEGWQQRAFANDQQNQTQACRLQMLKALRLMDQLEKETLLKPCTTPLTP